MLRKINIVLKGTLHLFKFWKFFKKEKIIYIFSSRFGHFLQNTEILLRELNRKEIKKTLFVLDEKIDNYELLDIWKKYNLDFCSYEFGKLLSLVKKKAYYNHFVTVPQKKLFFQNKRILKHLIPNHQIFDSEYTTITFRDSKYNIENYNYSGDMFRDTKKKDIRLLVEYFKKKKIKLVKVNKSFDKVNGIIDYGYNKNYELEKAFSIIKNTKFHIGSSTGIDTVAAFCDKPMINPNTLLGNNFISRLYTYPTFIIPINLKYKKDRSIVPLSKQVKLLKYAEKNIFLHHLDINLQNKFGVYYESNSFLEIISGYEEYNYFLKNKFKFNKKFINYQKKFWSIYPKVYKNRIKTNIITTSNKFIGNIFIPSSYFDKYKNFLK